MQEFMAVAPSSRLTVCKLRDPPSPRTYHAIFRCGQRQGRDMTALSSVSAICSLQVVAWPHWRLAEWRNAEQHRCAENEILKAFLQEIVSMSTELGICTGLISSKTAPAGSKDQSCKLHTSCNWFASTCTSLPPSPAMPEPQLDSYCLGPSAAYAHQRLYSQEQTRGVKQLPMLVTREQLNSLVSNSR